MKALEAFECLMRGMRRVDKDWMAHEIGIVEQALEQQEWQPIETAPHYQNVLVWREDAGSWIARFDSNCHYILDDDLCDPDYEWWISGEYGFHEENETPTHWKPLPEPPTQGDV